MNIDNHVIFSQQDPDDPQVDVESNRSRLARRAQTEQELRSVEIAAKRAARLDKYFSQHPPNGPRLTIYRDLLANFTNTDGKSPRWLSYEQLEASFDRLQRKGILTIESAQDALGCLTFKSSVTAEAMAKRRNVRSSEINTLVVELKKNLGNALDEPAIPPRVCTPVHGCRYVPVIYKWRVSLFFGGRQHALGCYSLSTALRLQDVLALHFSPYRRPGNYNTSEAEAVELLTKHPALQAFADALETQWLSTGVLVKPGAATHTLESRITAVESQLTEIKISLDEIRRLMQVTPA